jgi:cytochrome c biogenesis protein
MSTTETDTSTGTDAHGAAGANAPADASATDDAASRKLSTAPVEDLGQAVPGSFGGVRTPGVLGAVAWTGREVLGWVRWFWRQLTSMRVALLLLFLLSLTAIPGSLVPQTAVDPIRVDEFRKNHPTLTPVYDKLQLFHVYSSVWFSAVYILLFVSLAGCILPRCWQFVGQLRSKPPAAPRDLTRMPAHTTWRTDAEPEQVAEAAQRALRARRFRVARTGTSLASEKGYLRETGNLLFHIALFGLLLAFAAGQLWHGHGTKVIVEGDSFSNTATAYDEFDPSAFYTAADLPPFSFKLDDFTATYARSGPDKGTPRIFKANIHYRKGATGKSTAASIEVNKPLTISGSRVYLDSHGYAPVVTVRDASGQVAYTGPVVFLPLDNNLTSHGVIKVPDGQDKNGKNEQLGFSGLFLPSATVDPVQGPISTFPALDKPRLILNAYHGDLGLDDGTPQNVYQLDTKHLKLFKAKDGQPFAEELKEGDTMKLPGGAGTLTFDGVKTFAQFEVNHQPGDGWALASAVAAIIGLAGSLFIQRRRVWVRAVPAPDGPGSVVEMAGLGRSESARIGEELGELVGAVLPAAPVRTEPAPDAGKTDEPAPEAGETDESAPDAGETGGAGPAEPGTPTEDASEDEGARA